MIYWYDSAEEAICPFKLIAGRGALLVFCEQSRVIPQRRKIRNLDAQWKESFNLMTMVK